MKDFPCHGFHLVFFNCSCIVSASVGCISSVNSLIGEKGLQRRGFLPSLVTDSSGSHLHQEDPHIQRSKETLLEVMDHRRKAGIKRKARSMTSSATKTDQQSIQQQQKPSVINLLALCISHLACWCLWTILSFGADI